MKLLTTAITAGAVLLGGLAAAVGYNQAISPAQVTKPVSQVEAPAPEVKHVVKFKKCKAPAVREGKLCVTHAAPAPVYVSSNSSSGGAHHATGSHHGDDHESDHEDEHENEHEDD